MGFECCHPAVNLIYFTAVLVGMILFQHPIYLFLSLFCAFAYSVKRNGRKAVVFNLCLLPLAAAFALYYSAYHHFGLTVLRQNLIGNNMTLESLVYGLVLGCSGMGVCIWFSCIYSVFSSDKVVYLFGKVSPGLSLFLAILLRLIPRMKNEAKKIHRAQKGIGKGIDQGNLWQRLCNGVRIFSIMITWMIGALGLASDSMRSRGSSLRGRTAFSIYRFDNRDRTYVVGLFLCITITMMAAVLKQTDMVYNPRILWQTLTPASLLFYAAYVALCLLPLGLEVSTEILFSRSRRRSLK